MDIMEVLMNNKNYIITKDDIYIAEVVVFDDINGNYLMYKDLKKEDTFRKVLVKDKLIIDFKTGEIIYPLNIINGVIENTIFKDYMYCTYLIKPNLNQISDNDLLYASNLYKMFLERQKLIKQKKLILFPPTRLN